MDQKTKLLETRAKLRKKPFDYHVTLPVNRVYELDFGGMGGNDGRRDYSELTNVVEGVDMDLLNLPFPEKLHFTAEEMEASDASEESECADSAGSDFDESEYDSRESESRDVVMGMYGDRRRSA